MNRSISYPNGSPSGEGKEKIGRNRGYKEKVVIVNKLTDMGRKRETTLVRIKVELKQKLKVKAAKENITMSKLLDKLFKDRI